MAYRIWTAVVLIFSFVYYTFFFNIFYANDYLNPFTLTFKNPKTIQMLNIIILYHYVMAFLMGIIIFTFIFIFLSFFRTYIFFYPKPFFTHYEENSERGKNFIFFSAVDR